MKITVVVILVSALLLTASCFAWGGSGHGDGDGHGHGDGHEHGHGGCDPNVYGSWSERGTSSGPYPLLRLVMIPGKEIAPTKASWGWQYVEPPSKKLVAAEKSRDQVFRKALQAWGERHPSRMVLLAEENPRLAARAGWTISGDGLVERVDVLLWEGHALVGTAKVAPSPP